MAIFLKLCALILLFHTISAVDKNNFKTCDQSSFCRRLRKVEPNKSPYELDLESLQVTDHSVESELVNKVTGDKYKLSLTALVGNTFRLIVDEEKSLHPRNRVEVSLDGEPQVSKLEILDRNKHTVLVKSGNNKVILNAFPFKIDFFNNGKLVSVINGRGLFTFEALKAKKPEESENEDPNQPKEDPGAWEENFKSHQDSKPRGPEAIGIDITFPGALRAYGIPEHADKFALRTTGPGGLDPYRLYNLDVFEYEINSQMAIYGSVPVLYAHSAENTVGVFWNNAAEMWVDIINSKDGNVMSSIVNLVSGQRQEDRVDTHFMSESGIVDLFVFMGPTPKEAIRQYAAITGVAPLPQYFALGYHQCRWNYNDEDDVRTVIDRFDEHDLPVDVIWLDIEYTEGKKYFTWDSVKFGHPLAMQRNLTATGRKLVAIIDPHVKREGGYFLHEDSLANGYYVKNKDGSVYEGWCWPGSSSYPDFLDPKVVDYYAGLYAYDKFPGSTEDLHIWNDMNEPSVFNGPEITMPKDLVHYGGWEHRHIHNIYGLLYSMVTYKGLMARSANRRPFILTRAHSPGSQRYTAMWTGDNAAEWSHLAMSLPMCLSEAVAGISFCGADIGGFFNNPDVELLQRWYQTGAWLPFFRAHAHIDTKRREPYLYEQDVRTRIRNALRQRYAHLPLWYTLFWEHERYADPVIRPLFYQYPSDENVLDIDDQILIGTSVMFKPITQSGSSTITIYFPGGATERWYDIDDYKPFTGATGAVTMPTCLDKMHVYYRGGSIIPRKDRPRRSSVLTHDDPFTLYIALDENNSAVGTLYIDDAQSFEYKNKKYLYIRFEFNSNTLTSSLIDSDADYPSEAWLERVVIIAPPKNIAHAKLSTQGGKPTKLQTTYDGEHRSLTIRKPGISLREPFKITLH